MLRKIYHEVGRSRRDASLEVVHEFLVEGSDLHACSRKLFSFFDSYQLVRYGQLEVVAHNSISAEVDGFRERLDASVEKNRDRVRSFLEELRLEGVNSMEHLATLPQGYQSKTLHTLTHLLDGFFGIDTYFFNLVEGSHWVSEELREKITAVPNSFMLLDLRAYT